MMAKQSKRLRDPNQLAKLMIDIVSSDIEEAEKTFIEKRASTNDKMCGPTRAKALMPEERSQIASFAAQASWQKANLLRLDHPLQLRNV
jgi:hypothetical protein